MKEVKIVVQNLRNEISENLMKEYEKQFSALKIKEMKREKEEVRASKVKKDPEENFLMIYEKMPKGNLEVTKLQNAGKITEFSEHQCEVCQKFYSSKKYLKTHLDLHFKSQRQKCENCHKTFFSSLKFKAHSCTSRTCPQCFVTFGTKRALRLHMKKIHKTQLFPDGYCCDYCGDKFEQKFCLKYHVRNCVRVSAKFYFCDHCERSFRSKNNLKSHLASHIAHKVNCKVCNVKVQPYYLKSHMKLFHPEIEKHFKCQKCLKNFQTFRIYKTHLKTHNKIFECSICDLKFPYEGTLKSHMKFHEDPEQFRCQICGHQSKNKSQLKAHLKTHNKNREKHLKCSRCDFKTYDKNTISNHLKVHAKLDAKLKNPNAVKCEKCFSVLNNEESYKKHILNQHQGVKLFCDLCEYSSNNKQNMRVHLKAKHFKHLKMVIKNMKFHENPMLFQCQICEYQGKKKSNLESHLRIHDKNREKNLKCNRCDYKTDRKQNLSIHLKSHARLDEKLKKYPNAVKCEKCFSVLKNEDAYKIHIFRHHKSEKLFYCNWCEYSSKTKHNVRRHLISNHLK